MFTFLFKGAASNIETFYYNSSQYKAFSSLLLLFKLIVYSKQHSRGTSFYKRAEQQNVEDDNTKYDTFIDRNKCSLSSSRGQPRT